MAATRLGARPRARARPRPRPLRAELGVALVVTTAWVVLGVLGVESVGGGPHAHGGGAAGGGGSAGPALALGGWVLMVVAMMGPAALAGVRHTAEQSLRRRRARATAEFALAYLAVWTAVGIVTLTLGARLGLEPGAAPLAMALVAAAAWQLTPWKRRWLRDCHRPVPLPPTGWVAERGALRFGLRNGLACVGSCWVLMLVMLAAPGGHLLWTAGLTIVITTERWLARPRLATRWIAAGLAASAVVTAGVALIH